MSALVWIVLYTFTVSLVAFIGVIALFLKEGIINKILLVLVAFSAGALMGGAFLHLIPEAIIDIGFDEMKLLTAFSYLLFGFCMFFVLEQFIRWHHHHSTSHPKIMPFSYMILISDGVHNFIDGLVVAASFIVSFPVGITTTLAIALHEIPQEIGDFGILVYGGFKKSKALILNYISATAIIFGGIVGYLMQGWLGESIVFLLPFTAGNFIYIATTDLIPEIRYKQNLLKTFVRFFVFLAGLVLMIALKLYF